MQEYRAAAAGDARGSVVIDLDDEIVEVVVAPEPVAAAIAVEPNRLIIMAVARIFPPGGPPPDGAEGEMRARAWVAVGPPPPAPRAGYAFSGPPRALPPVCPASPP